MPVCLPVLSMPSHGQLLLYTHHTDYTNGALTDEKDGLVTQQPYNNMTGMKCFYLHGGQPTI